MQNEDQNKLFSVVDDYIDKAVIKRKNRRQSWAYGYNKEYDIVVISKDGKIGQILNIKGLLVALPPTPKECQSRSHYTESQYWEKEEEPKDLRKIKSIFQWNNMPNDFKSKWVGYIEKEFDNREYGFFFMNNGKPTYITGSHYMYLQWSNIDIGYPDFR